MTHSGADEPTLARKVDEHLLFLANYYGRVPGARLYDDPDLVRLLTPDFPGMAFNAIYHADFSPREAETRITTAINYYKSRVWLVDWGWWITPATRPTDLGQRLKARGFSRLAEFPAMILDLRDLEASAPDVPGLTIERVTDDATLVEWMQPSIIGNDLTDEWGELYLEHHRQAGYGDGSPMQHFLARVDDVPVGGVSLLVDLAAETAGIHSLVTDPDHRGQGIATALTLHALEEGAAQGCRYSVLWATHDSYSLYERLGFQEVSVLEFYVYRNRKG
jgi:ribosomal protein S18 acetylase RimI-like enzyme